MYQRKKTNLIKEFGSCTSNENHAVLDLTCTNYGECVYWSMAKDICLIISFCLFIETFEISEKLNQSVDEYEIDRHEHGHELLAVRNHHRVIGHFWPLSLADPKKCSTVLAF